jgi:hypothetical protein
VNVGSFPIYILDLSGTDHVVHPDGFDDIPHSEFWKSIVAKRVARHFGLPVKWLLNLPYSQRRARIVVRNYEAVANYGERQTKKLLRLISESVGLPHLKWRHDVHERRLDFDMTEFLKVMVRSGR